MIAIRPLGPALLLIALLACRAQEEGQVVDEDAPPPRYQPVELHRGHYVIGGTSAHFTPCGLDERWALVTLDTVGELALRAHSRRVEVVTDAPATAQRAYAELRGDTSAIGASADVDGADRSLTVREILDVREARVGDCP